MTLLDDGLMEIKVLERKSDDLVTCEVKVGGNLKSRKGINVPQLQIDCSALTVKDREDAAYLLSMGVDYIALSFAQRKQDIEELIEVMDQQGVPKDQRPERSSPRSRSPPRSPTSTRFSSSLTA